MIVDTKYIRNEILKIGWPKVTVSRITPWTPKYCLISEVMIGKLLEKSFVPLMTYIPDFAECDFFALQFQAETRHKRYLAHMRAREQGEVSEELKYPVPMAIAWGDMFRGKSENHVANLFVCEEGIRLADAMPMEKRYWKASSDNDNMFTIDFR